jgi:hypothetical protein
MRRYILVVLLCCMLSVSAQTQQDSAKHMIYAELFGTSDIYSINYEYLLSNTYTLRAGVSWLPGSWQLNGLNHRSFYYLPLEFNRIFGASSHKIATSVSILATLTYGYTTPNHYRFEPSLGCSYRYQPKGSTVFLKAGVNLRVPVYLSSDVYEVFLYTHNNWLLWPQVAAGYKF